MSMSQVMGIDLSLNHFAAVIVSLKGDVQEIYYAVQKKKYLGWESSDFLVTSFLILKRAKDQSRELYTAHRRYVLAGIFGMLLNKLADKCYVCLENYAFSAHTQSAYQIGEVSGILQNACFGRCCTRLRLHDPTTVKMFATGKGNASKKEMAESVKENLHIPQMLLEKTKGDYDGPYTDIVDAYVLAQMVKIELEVRNGLVELKDLTEGQRRVFLRTTDKNPINLLERPFIEWKQT